MFGKKTMQQRNNRYKQQKVSEKKNTHNLPITKYSNAYYIMSAQECIKHTFNTRGEHTYYVRSPIAID